jgi:DNA-binding transcriptional MerR regulator
MAEEKKEFITISQLQQITDLPLSTLRHYEAEFTSYLRVHKTSRGHRRYSTENVERFLHLKELIHVKGFSIKDVKRSIAPDEAPERLREELDLLLQVAEELTKQNGILRESLEEMAKRVTMLEDELRSRKSGFKWFR